MGGTFDPIHYGHLILAEQAWEEFGLEKVLFVTAADPPHKSSRSVTPAHHRHAMTGLAIQKNAHFELSSVEIDRPGPSYTVDTLRLMLDFYGDSIDMYLLLGTDEAECFMSWREPRRIIESAKLVVANRPGCSIESALEVLPDDISSSTAVLRMPGVDISSSDLRERVNLGRSIRYLVPEPVEDYIIENGLYASQSKEWQ